MLEQYKDGNWSIQEKTSESLDISSFEPDEDLMKKLEPFDKKAKEDANTVIGNLKGGSLAPDNEIQEIPSA